MKRTFVLGGLIAMAALSFTVSAYQTPQQGPRTVIALKVKDNLYMLNGGGGTTGVFIGTNGVVVVDTKNPGWGQPILDAIKELTPKPVTMIINTHTHLDHVAGNIEFPASVDVVAQENTAANMKDMRASTQTAPSGQPPNIFKANNGRGMPTKTFKDRMTIGTGADRIDLYYFGRGHTNGDAWVVFPALRAMHAGDIFSGKNIPGLDAVNGGSGLAIADSLTKAADTVKNIDTIITGHSSTMTMADLREYARFNRDFANDVRTAKAAGKSADEVAKAWKIPTKYAGYATPIPVRLLQNVQVVYDELK